MAILSEDFVCRKEVKTPEKEEVCKGRPRCLLARLGEGLVDSVGVEGDDVAGAVAHGSLFGGDFRYLANVDDCLLLVLIFLCKLEQRGGRTREGDGRGGNGQQSEDGELHLVCVCLCV